MTTDTSTETSASEEAQGAASIATDETRKVAGVAADEARNLADEAKTHARNVAGQAMSDVQSQVEDQSRTQKDKLAATLSTFGDDLGSMAQNSSGLAANVAHEVAHRAQTLGRRLDGREPRELLDDMRRFARRRPGSFLLGALVTGVVVGRIARSTKDSAAAADAGLAPAGSRASAGSELTEPPRVTPGAGDTTSVPASHGQPTQPTQPPTEFRPPTQPVTAPASGGFDTTPPTDAPGPTL